MKRMCVSENFLMPGNASFCYNKFHQQQLCILFDFLAFALIMKLETFEIITKFLQSNEHCQLEKNVELINFVDFLAVPRNVAAILELHLVGTSNDFRDLQEAISYASTYTTQADTIVIEFVSIDCI